ncbi:histidine kinase dimerization/phospho-acceptor domain-containing protein [Psychrobium sp. 1_MG-2023]|uniref:histidine kinase dimerization/phospho-acceptor domain-containing protein n=1 Tax=Psychrobium sp. 1_MG-2023 TaxID=3062624 RepID=UPI000C337ED7|nr:histidine kinase dimerization/phospho-acceptor domain-containing protein [Psychrobium sp. 1_MG-2023]MDP2561656.1 response regulator [Psychrobium sp. 1_MG-2023]PKF55672.1 hypothetical protein CW748_12510 [Alteromonadales bacterium alter-6D02]
MELLSVSTLATSTALLSVVLFAIIWTVYKDAPGSFEWLLTLTLYACAVHLLSNVNTSLSLIYIANIALGASCISFLRGVNKLYRRIQPSWWFPVAIFIPYCSVLYIYTFEYPQLEARVITVSSFILLCFSNALYNAIVPVERTKTVGNILIVLMCLIICIVMSWRIFDNLLIFKAGAELKTALFTLSLVGQATTWLMIFYSIVMVFIFTLLCAEYKLAQSLQEKINATQETDEQSNFIATLSHQLTPPLHLISSTANHIQHRLYDDKTQQQTNTIINASDSLQQLISSVLQYSHVINKKTPLNMHFTALEDWLNEIVNLFRPIAENKNLKLDLTIKGDVAPSYLLDTNKLKVILVNLISNAINDTADGYIQLTVSCLPLNNKSGLQEIAFELLDTAINSSQHVESIDEATAPHKAAQSAEQYLTNSNLNLAISKKIISALNSQLTVTNNENKGNKLTFSITTSIGEKSNSQTHSNHASKSKPLKILIIEQINNGLLELIDTLNQDHHNISLATKYQQATDCLQKHTYDAVLLDMNQPALNALNLHYQTIKGDGLNNRTPFIALTTLVSPEAIAHYRHQGLIKLLSRPIQTSLLRRSLKDVTTNHNIIKAYHQAADKLSAVVKVTTSTTDAIADTTKQSETESKVNTTPKVTSKIEPTLHEQQDSELLSAEDSPLPQEFNDLIADANLQQSQDIKNRSSNEEQEQEQEQEQQEHIFNPSALNMLEKNKGDRTLLQVVEKTMNEIQQLLPQIRKQLATRELALAKDTLYQFALAADKLGFSRLAETALTLDMANITGTGSTEYKIIKEQLNQSLTQLSARLKEKIATTNTN